MKTLAISLIIALSTAVSFTGFGQQTKFPSVGSAESINTEIVVTSFVTDKIDVTVKKPGGSNMWIEFMDGDGRILASVPVGKDIGSARARFDVSKLPDGDYKVIVTGGDTRQVKNISLNTQFLKTIQVG